MREGLWEEGVKTPDPGGWFEWTRECLMVAKKERRLCGRAVHATDAKLSNLIGSWRECIQKFPGLFKQRQWLGGTVERAKSSQHPRFPGRLRSKY